MKGGILNLPSCRDLGGGWAVRLLPAREELDARREGEELAEEERDSALCANACLLARALLRNGEPAFENGREVLETLTAGQIGDLARRWSEFDRECDPAPWDEEAAEQAKKAWSTRRTSAFSGACSKLLGRFLPRRE